MGEAPDPGDRESRPDRPSGPPRAVVVGAGLAGMTAALRLLERGFRVRMLELNYFLGGKLGAYSISHQPSSRAASGEADYAADYHEHSFHMYLNWYHNFWRLADDIGIIDRFVPQPSLTYLKRGEYPAAGRESRLTDVGAAATAWQNLFSGVESPADMYLYGYSLVDLLARGGSADLDRASVSSFLESRPYFTPQVETLHRHTLAKAFASPTYLNSAQSYRRFIGYGFGQPSPMTWLLKGNTGAHLFGPFEQHLKEVGGDRFELLRGVRIDEIRFAAGRMFSLAGKRLVDQPPDRLGPRPAEIADFSEEVAETDSVILAVPFQAVSEMLNHGPLLLAAPSLGKVRKLRGQPMASIDIYFKKKLRNIPRGITLLADSPFDLTFVDNSQLWDNGDGGPPDRTFLNLVISDFSIFASHKASEDDVWELALGGRRAGSQRNPYGALILESALAELRHYIEFDYHPDFPAGMVDDKSFPYPVCAEEDDVVDRPRCHIQTNFHEQLFVNEVGSWDCRPGTTCEVPNLFVAGDYCRTFVDVVTIEGAVVSGLMAAEAARARAGLGQPVEIVRPETVPLPLLRAMKWMGAPYAYAAHAWSRMESELQSGYRTLFPNG